LFWHKPRCNDGSIREKLGALDDAIGGDEAAALAVLDVDEDGCVDKWEWMWTLQSEFGLGPVAANSSFPFAAISRCANRGSLVALIQDCGRPVRHGMFGHRGRRHAGRFFSFLGGAFGKMFGKPAPTLWDTDCDCRAARGACMSDARVSHLDVCRGQSVCGQG